MSANKRMRALLSALFVAAASSSHASQKIVADGVSAEATVSQNELTRIRVDGANIVDVVGNIYSSTCSPKTDPSLQTAAPAVNPQGEFVLACDLAKGEIFVRPVGKSSKPINMFISTEKATYTLLLRPADLPAQTITLVDKTARKAAPVRSAAPQIGRAMPHVRALKEMLLVMSGARNADDISAEEVSQENHLWKEARLELVRQYSGRGMVGEQYQLTNVSDAVMVLAEQEFDRDDGAVLAVAIDNLNLRPGQQTTVNVIRTGE